ncbi:MAG: NAD-dependent epimerase/dehydratase family protein [Acidobacteria bacterium]|nr:NAD-dependent epimerase/dehydratase family protein [Acidobacteriota bacterium]MYD70863.1 NAD-dependent epimerase/dehydratase family protein [Acidobacteriota bacterium]MYJ05175.1 NAD-dependent epimerase/dehydratase family protein [Acidobacteriota bacterium]
MSVLVTGVTGFTGGHLARHLAERGQSVRGLVRPASRDRAGALSANGVAIVAGDLTDAASLPPACEGVDIVYHIAATYRTAGHSDSAYHAVNAEGTRALIAAARKAGARRFVHCSTGGVHGHIERPPANEDAPLAPGDVYQASKLEGERIARAEGEADGLEVVVARPIGIYGPGDTRFLKMFRAIARRRFPMIGRGEVFYHLTYIDDLVEGFRRCGEIPAAAGRTYLLAGPRYTTLAELVGMIAAEFGVPPPRWRIPVAPVWLAGALCELLCVPFRIEPPLYRRRVDFFTKSRAFDGSRARLELGFEPAIDLPEGIHRTAVGYRERGWL